MRERYKLVYLNGNMNNSSIQDTDAPVLTFYNDLGFYNAIKPVCDLLNTQNEKIEELEERNKRQYKRLSEIGDLILDRNWKELDKRATELEENERLLQEEWRFYE